MKIDLSKLGLVILICSISLLIGVSAITAESSMQVQTTLTDSVISMSDGAEVIVIPIGKIEISTDNTGQLSNPVTVKYEVVHERTGEKAIRTRNYQIDSTGKTTATDTLRISEFRSDSYPIDAVTSLNMDVKADHPKLDPTVDTKQIQIARGVDNTNCNTIKNSDPNADSGVYDIQPDGVSSEFSVYCDMSTNGGGWTMVMTLDDDSDKFTYNSAYWTDENTLNSDDSNPFDSVGGNLSNWQGNDLDGARKYKSFHTVGATDMRLEFGNPSHSINYQGDLADDTALSVFAGEEDRTFSHEGSCSSSVATNHPDFDPNIMILGRGIQVSGVNIVDEGNPYGDGKFRFGFGSDEDSNHGAGSLNLGVGDDGSSVTYISGSKDSGNCGYDGTTSGSSRDTSAVLWVR